MKTFIAALLLIAAIALPSFAQCENGQCPTQNQSVDLYPVDEAPAVTPEPTPAQPPQCENGQCENGQCSDGRYYFHRSSSTWRSTGPEVSVLERSVLQRPILYANRTFYAPRVVTRSFYGYPTPMRTYVPRPTMFHRWSF